MKFTKFEFQNFRGIPSGSFDLSRSAEKAVHVLVGLNESGKTTILEAINSFRTNPNLRAKDPRRNTRTDAECQAMLPITKRSLFTGEIQICGHLKIDDVDQLLIEDFLKSEFGFVETYIDSEIIIRHRTIFEDSKRTQTTNGWSLHVEGRKKRPNGFH